MAADNFRLVFDVATTDRWSSELFPFFALPAIVLVLVLIPQRILDRIPGFHPKGVFAKMLVIIIFAFSTLILGIATLSHYQQLRALRGLERNGALAFVEGCLQAFHPMPASGHQDELIKVNGVPFSYSDFDESTPGFNNTESHGGPIHADSAVRIWYVRNAIVRLAVKDHACPGAPDFTW